MELEFAKEFIYRDIDTHTIYITKTVDKLLEICPKHQIRHSAWAVLDTERGMELFELDMTYSDELFLWMRFMHRDSFFGFYGDYKIVNC